MSDRIDFTASYKSLRQQMDEDDNTTHPTYVERASKRGRVDGKYIVGKILNDIKKSSTK